MVQSSALQHALRTPTFTGGSGQALGWRRGHTAPTSTLDSRKRRSRSISQPLVRVPESGKQGLISLHLLEAGPRYLASPLSEVRGTSRHTKSASYGVALTALRRKDWPTRSDGYGAIILWALTPRRNAGAEQDSWPSA